MQRTLLAATVDLKAETDNHYCLFAHICSRSPSLLARIFAGLNGLSGAVTQTFTSEGSELLTPVSGSGSGCCAFLFSTKTGQGVPVDHLEVEHLLPCSL